MDIKNILEKCDHTLLRVDCTSAEIRTLCDQAIKYNCASVCIPPCHVSGAKRYVGGRMKICTVIGFPNGYMTTAAKAFEAADAVKNGADEIDMVINLSMVKDGCWDAVAKDISAVREATRGHILKVIIECCLLTDEEKVQNRVRLRRGLHQDLHRLLQGRCNARGREAPARELPRQRQGKGCRRHIQHTGRGGLHRPRR